MYLGNLAVAANPLFAEALAIWENPSNGSMEKFRYILSNPHVISYSLKGFLDAKGNTMDRNPRGVPVSVRILILVIRMSHGPTTLCS